MTNRLAAPNNVNHVAGTTPTLLVRPSSHITSIRGGPGTPDNDSVNPSTDFSQDQPAKSGFRLYAQVQGADKFRIALGTKVPQNFDSTADVDLVENTITIVDHGYHGGEGPFRLTGVLPTGLALATDYWVIAPKLEDDQDTFRLASSLANANARVAVDITATAVGTGTITGMTNITEPPTAQTDGSGSIEVLPGADPIVLPSAERYTVVGFGATPVLTYWWA